MDGVFSPVSHPWEFWALALMALVVDLRQFRASGSTRRFANIFVSVCFGFVIMLIWGLGWAIAVQTVATVGAGVWLRLGVRRTLILVGQFVLSLAAAYGVLAILGAPSFVLGQRMTGADGLDLVVAAVVWLAVNYSIFVLWLRFRSIGSWRQVFTSTLGYELLSTGALLLLAPLFVGAPTGWGLLLVFVPVLAVSQLARLYNEQGAKLRLDSLTGLLSRRAIIEEIDERTAIQRSAGTALTEQRFALLLLDLDRFRQVNDAFGHAVGDRLLAVVAERLRDNVRKIDLVARMGGDEFAILQPHLPDPRAAQALASHVARAVAAPAEVDGQPLDMNASIGVALYPDHGTDHATLLRHAEVAMYLAKHRADTIAVYTTESEQNSALRLSLLADLRRALEDPAHRDEIQFVYQPQVAITNGEVVGVEALLRWHHPDRGLVNVEDVLQVAEQSPVIRRLTRRVVDDVVDQLAQWNSAGRSQQASINVSVRDLDTPDLVNHIAEALRPHRIRAEQLKVEITETALMGDPGPAQATLRALADLGVKLSLDDFGTGYSSLAHLQRLPVTEIKIDRSFTSRMAQDPDDDAIVRSIIDMARALRIRVVAEGVENEQTYHMLADAGCEVAQGWLIARAMPADQLMRWLAQRGPFGTGDHRDPDMDGRPEP